MVERGAWSQLKQQIGGNLIEVPSLLADCATWLPGSECLATSASTGRLACAIDRRRPIIPSSCVVVLRCSPR